MWQHNRTVRGKGFANLCGKEKKTEKNGWFQDVLSQHLCLPTSQYTSHWDITTISMVIPIQREKSDVAIVEKTGIPSLWSTLQLGTIQRQFTLSNLLRFSTLFWRGHWIQESFSFKQAAKGSLCDPSCFSLSLEIYVLHRYFKELTFQITLANTHFFQTTSVQACGKVSIK